MIEYFNDVSGRIERSYRGYLLQLIGIYAQLLDGPSPTTPVVRGRFEQKAQEAQVSALSAITTTIDEAVVKILDGAITNANPSLSEPQREALTVIVKEARSALIAQLSLAMTKDANTVAERLRVFAMHVDRLMNAKGITYMGAVITARTQIGTEFKFHQTDRALRKWASTIYAKTSVRMFLVRSYIDSYAAAYAATGKDLLKVIHIEEGHRHDGVVFSISGSDANYPSYSNIRDEIWHPNSRALVSQP